MVRITLHCLAMFILVHFFSISNLYSEPYHYQHQETRQLVGYVEQAARKLSREGRSAFPALRKISSQGFYDDRTLFIFDETGRPLFYPEDPELEGVDFSNFRDVDGKPIFRHMAEVVNESDSSAGWVHYLGRRRDHVFPEWKASYVMKVMDRDGKTYIIGSGLFSPRLEKRFIKDLVDSAARQVEAKGVSVLKTLNKKSGRFVFGDVMMIALKMDGTLLLDPTVLTARDQDNQIGRRNLMDFHDSIGNYVFRDIIGKLKTENSVWVLYMWPKPGEIKPSKKALYMRKVKVGGTPYLIGSGFFLARPVWMK